MGVKSQIVPKISLFPREFFMFTVTDESGHLQCADLHFEDDAFCQKTEQVQD